jgi:hypothetical protein
LDEIRSQLEPELVDIPGFKPGSFITVLVRCVDLTPHLLQIGLGNPLLDPVLKKANEVQNKGKPIEAVVTEVVSADPRRSLEQVMPIVDAVVKESLVSPTLEEISEIHPLSWAQKSAIFQKAVGDLRILRSFRGK